MLKSTSLRRSGQWHESRKYCISCLLTVVANEVIIRGVRLVYLPGYSPDLNPIKEGFSAMKAWIRKNNSFVRAALNNSPKEASRVLQRAVVESMTPEKAVGWFEH